jgi:hypothetical protein
MAHVCRTYGCAHAPIDGLGHCLTCGHRYAADRRADDALAAAARRQNWELFVFLDETYARRFAEHLVGNARIGPGAILYAVIDLLAEAEEAALLTIEPTAETRSLPRGPQLRLIHGGAS